MKHLIVTECYESIPISVMEEAALTPLEADELSRYVRIAGLDEDLIRITRTEVIFINYVGFIQLTSCSIEILPKVAGDDPVRSRKVLLRMLQKTGYLDIHESQLGLLVTEKMNLFEIIAYLFTGKLIKELNKGVYHSYRVQYEELQSVRGKINLVSQLQRTYNKSTDISCIFDEFQTDNVLNRILKAAIRRVITLSKHMETRKKARQSMIYLDEVDESVDIRQLPDEFNFDRNNKRFQESWRMAKLILSQTTSLSAAGKSQNTSILFKMNDLFEMYMAYLVKKVAMEVIVKDHSYKLLIKDGTQRGVFQLEPDLLVSLKNGSKVIIDTKWKRIDSSIARHGVQRNDFYQMYAYLTRYDDVGTVFLLYPHHDGIFNSGGTFLESWGLEQDERKKLKVFSISYEDEFKAIDELSTILL
ncbi:ATP-dependent helicase [Paenibacillus sp. LMG 31458]|uniref:ATP-dependent helicase n=1 Tax=Paenibacillus phytorum TaxID=2654977 RepID=A0ABX1XZI5_9BACL|nr:ATP-dependent helicase [Paenibacillus phytorum]NOU73983.1 ATP-dependent helicase [Paenibacillus phytorum]